MLFIAVFEILRNKAYLFGFFVVVGVHSLLTERSHISLCVVKNCDITSLL